MESFSLRRFVGDRESPFAIGQRLGPLTTDQEYFLISNNEPLATSPVQIPESSEVPPAYHSSDASSTTLSRASTNLSRKSSRTTASETTSVSTAPSIGLPPLPTIDQQLLAMSIHGSNYPCIFTDIVKCDNVDLEDFEEWFEHHIDHFGPRGPPNHALCVFCDIYFEREDAQDCWTEYLSHIYDHFVNGKTLNERRPDFRVFRDLWRNGQMSDDTYHILCDLGSERPPLEGLKPLDWEPEEVVLKRMRELNDANCDVIVESQRRTRDRQRVRQRRRR